MYIIFDTETTGLPENYNAKIEDIQNWPRLVQIAWRCYDDFGELIEKNNFIIKPNDFDIPFNAIKIHGITKERALKEGYDIKFVLKSFKNSFKKIDFIIGHNINFDINIVSSEFFRLKWKNISFFKKKIIDLKEESKKYCNLYNKGSKRLKWPTLSELYKKLFGVKFLYSHNANFDVKATSLCFFKLLRLGIISNKKNNFYKKSKCLNLFKDKKLSNIELDGIDNTNYKILESYNKKQIIKPNYNIDKSKIKNYYCHLHNHTSFSILSSTTKIKYLIKRTIDYKMNAVGITDYGNMMGAFYFLSEIKNFNNKVSKKKHIKGIIGCEFFVSKNHLEKKYNRLNKLYNQVLLAKNKIGYHNLSKLCSFGFIEGYNYGTPRVSIDLIKKYKNNLIALSGDLNGEIPYTILNKGEIEGEKVFLLWHKIFGDDFYVELIRHGLDEEHHVNNILIKLSKKYKVKYIPQNNTFYLDKKDYEAHDILLCVRNGEKKNTPIGNGKGFRFGFPNQEFFFKNSKEMYEMFLDLPESFKYLEELVEKIEIYELNKNIILPKFKIPKYFLEKKNVANNYNENENLFLRYLTYKGAKVKYSNITNDIINRIEFELKIIKKTGYPSYFLIIQDITNQARDMEISVGPGRGSAAGSIVAYCTGITNIDPIKYNLLFERFLNPDRISLPDIDIDFDDRGREKIIEWVLNKYGTDKVAQIITYGTMAAKSAIRDTARVLGLPLYKADYLSKMIPNNISLKSIFKENLFFFKKKIKTNFINNIIKIKEILKEKSLETDVLKQAKIIEGSLRNIGVHACGIIITPSDIKNYIPVAISKDSKLLITQFDNNIVEKAGLLKMDFLGLKTLTIIKDTIKIAKNNNINIIDPNYFPLNDTKTYNLFQKGETIAIFQYESLGMQKYLKKLKPDNFEDLIAMNALYRPGPLQYIPNFISRKNGKELIKYDIPETKEFLKDTYGITIYQEQVMLISQKLAGFSKGEADTLRKAIGKKQKHILDKMKNKFLENSIKKGYSRNILEKIWNDWESFASYAFNKSHATCYAYIGYQTAYLKANYNSYYMASVLSNHMNNINDINILIMECKRMNIKIIGPNINESEHNFTVNHKNEILFGMTAIKGIGEMAVDLIIKERKKNGNYNSIFNLVERVDSRLVNKRVLEVLVLSGCFDEISNIHRAQYFNEENKISNLEKIIKYGIKYKEELKNNKNSIFRELFKFDILKPKISYCNKWSTEIKLFKEKEVLGFYVTSNPFNYYYYELKYFNNTSFNELNNNNQKILNNNIKICGIINKCDEKISINKKKYVIFSIEDYEGTNKEFILFEKDHFKYKDIIFVNNFIYINFIIIKHYSEIRTKIVNIYPIKEILNKLTNEINIYINLYKINSQLIKNLEKILTNYIGNKKINVIIFDNHLKIKLLSKKYFININKNFLNEINNIENIKIKLI